MAKYLMIPKVPGVQELAIFCAAIIGAGIGFIAWLPLVAMEMAGHLMGPQMALSLAQSYNPALAANLNSVGSLLIFLGISAFVFMDGPETVLMILTDTFAILPIGGFDASKTPSDLVLGVGTTGAEIAIRVSAPTIGIIMSSMVAMGFLMKTMPQLNVLSVGFAVYIVGGLLMLIFALFAINDTLAGFIGDTLTQVGMWVRSLGPGQ